MGNDQGKNAVDATLKLDLEMANELVEYTKTQVVESANKVIELIKQKLIKIRQTDYHLMRQNKTMSDEKFAQKFELIQCI